MLRKGLNSDELKRVITIEKFEDTKGVIRSRKSKIPKGILDLRLLITPLVS
jgi:hypothetical protein